MDDMETNEIYMNGLPMEPYPTSYIESVEMDKQSIEKMKIYFYRDLKWGRGYQSRIVFDFLLSAASHCKGGVILDAGAGHQRYKPFFEECLYLSQEHTAGIEFKNMTEMDYDLISPLDEKIPLANDCIDGVLSTSVIEHLKYPEKFFAEAIRVLRPGGMIFINVPFVYVEHETPFDFNRPTRYGLERWLTDAGFIEASIKPTSSSTSTVMSFIQPAIMNDVVKSKGLYDSVHDALQLSFGIHKVLALAKLFFPLSLYCLLRLLSLIVCSIFDRGPHENTNFPVGWVAVAKKPGVSGQALPCKNKQDFLRKFATVV